MPTHCNMFAEFGILLLQPQGRGKKRRNREKSPAVEERAGQKTKKRAKKPRRRRKSGAKNEETDKKAPP